MKIGIIQLGAKGDVVRTLPILIGIREKYPDSEITWITKNECEEIIKTSPYVKKTITLPVESSEQSESFDLLLNLDIEDDATELAKNLNSEKKLGFYKEDDFVQAFNLGAEYYLNTLFDDETKKNNRKSYQEMMFEAAELIYKNQHHPIVLTEQEKEYAKDFMEINNIDGNVIGIHLGASSRWPSKVWHENNLIEFIEKASEKNYKILLLAGPNEENYLEKIKNILENKNLKIYTNNPLNTDKEFFSLIESCTKVISGDSFALHVALALNKPTIGLFFCTTPHELESYNLLKKLTSPIIYNFFPEKMDHYSEDLTKSISAQEVIDALDNTNITKVVNAIIKKDNKFLLIKRAEGIHDGKWALPGGVLESNETIFDGLKRELNEELNINLIKITRKIANYNYKREDNSLTKGQSYLVEANVSNIKKNHEVIEWDWFSIEDLETLDHIEGLDYELLGSFN